MTLRVEQGQRTATGLCAGRRAITSSRAWPGPRCPERQSVGPASRVGECSVSLLAPARGLWLLSLHRLPLPCPEPGLGWGQTDFTPREACLWERMLAASGRGQHLPGLTVHQSPFTHVQCAQSFSKYSHGSSLLLEQHHHLVKTTGQRLSTLLGKRPAQIPKPITDNGTPKQGLSTPGSRAKCGLDQPVAS